MASRPSAAGSAAVARATGTAAGAARPDLAEHLPELPGCRPVRITRDAIDDYEGRFEYWDVEIMGNRPDSDWRFPPFRLSNYTEIIEAGWTDGEIERFILRDLPRTFHGLDRERQLEELDRGVELTHTRWDALVAAVAEQLALSHHLPVPAWIDEPERFLDDTWVLAEGEEMRQLCLMFAPGPFLRHGAVPHPGEFDERAGDTSEWEPRP